MDEREYEKANCYADSESVCLKTESTKNFAAKNQYFRLMVQKEQQRTKYQNESSRNRLLAIVIMISSIIIICLFIIISKQRRDKWKKKLFGTKKCRNIKMYN